MTMQVKEAVKFPSKAKGSGRFYMLTGDHIYTWCHSWHCLSSGSNNK